MKKLIILLISIAIISLFLFSASFVSAQSKADSEAINNLIDKYGETEDAGDMVNQAKLMTADRVWIGPFGSGRITNQAMNMESQQSQFDAAKGFLAGVKWFTDDRDRLIKIYGDGKVAVASFYRYRTFVLPPDTPLEKAELFSPPPPSVFTLVLEKKGDWKIVHTHVSSMNPPN